MTTSNDRFSVQIRLASRPTGAPRRENFEIVESPLPEMAEGDLLLRTVYLSLDPYMRGRMSGEKSYVEPYEIGATLGGGTVSEVVASRHPDYVPGDVVQSGSGWQSHEVVRGGRHVRTLDPAVAPVSTSLGVLGMPGFTAYAGLCVLGDPKPGETVAVAAATGPVGSMVGQLARIRGARAVGIAGGKAKVAFLDELGFDVCLDHRSPDFATDLAEATPEGVDVYFENVGGGVLEAMLPRLNTFARVPVCGVIAYYNVTEPAEGPDRAPRLMRTILEKSLTVRGFIQTEFVRSHYKQFLDEVTPLVGEGRIRYREDVVEGLENAPEAFAGLLEGDNFGKLLVRIAPDPTL